MLTKWLVGVIVIMSLTASAMASDPTAGHRAYLIRGESGIDSCQSFLAAARRGSPAYYDHLIWLNGFISAYDVFAAPGKFRGKPGTGHQKSTADLARWLAHYCKRHPRDAYAHAAYKLVRHLRNSNS